ncbi:arsenosugar biosynthesis radical SAM (seleno)protein ArsS [Gordonibacter massiliensis (ex Traore et al. 2017)]|uniref:arsenosugar biosynthesis radical SAM (seleno)protein ArsS n=1 Tax=Gordonibacter massiliensis (ex Traore et al. 2017) TaxID=1841863 RepID=UPI001C8C6173|nr:arsenosugar biosynthesis radical SAM (seleno)protein ArsS [Gordonibacter massiliensis (ex Traore et al. 2017)]MBX9034418.1 radical SAM/Cys-rich domain protein [Gordonibacter massiliensis (ex Traore et al. 2017)]
MEFDEGRDVRELVREYYGKTLQGSDDLKTDACCCTSHTPPKYVIDVMGEIDDEIMAHFYGCGSPIPPALEGATVLDLGCGTGRDVYICSKLVGPAGRVIGVDMTEQQLAFARSHEAAQMERFGFTRSNVEFHCGFIEDLAALGIEDESVDVVVSNCVINLSPFKDQVFKEICRVLKPGGELYFSDIFSDRRVPPKFYDDPVLRGECLSGALYIEDFRRILDAHGIATFYDVETEPLHVGDFQIETKLGCIGFASHTVRAVKCADLEDREENYGQTATYLGTMPENKRYFDLTEDLRFIKGRPVAVSGNMASMLCASRYAEHFEVTGNRDRHVGPYDREAAQEGLELKLGKRQMGLADLEEACRELGIEPFEQRVHDKELLRSAPELATMQVNVGYRCNLACSHCFLESGPRRTEVMSRDTMEAVLAAFATGGFRTLDITGGSPEMNPDLEWFVRAASEVADEVIVRSNLTILDMPEYRHFKRVYADCKVHLVTSLPYFNEQGCDLQRGRNVFDRVVKVLRELNGLGYGTDPSLKIDVAYNVSGPFLPPDQRELEEFYAFDLQREQHVKFDNLFAFNNYALGRFANELKFEGKFDYYMNLLAENYNAAVVARMMCRSQVNVDFDGRLYDCEVNHVLGLPLDGPRNVRDLVDEPLGVRTVATSPICYSCAAGCGSSCGGSLMDKYGE